MTKIHLLSARSKVPALNGYGYGYGIGRVVSASASQNPRHR